MSTIRFYRNRDHQPRIEAGADLFTPAEFLQNDVQDAATGREILDLLTSNGPAHEFTGNSYSVTIKDTSAVLENLFDDTEPAMTMDRNQLAALLRCWLEFLDQDNLLARVPDFRHLDG